MTPFMLGKIEFVLLFIIIFIEVILILEKMFTGVVFIECKTGYGCLFFAFLALLQGLYFLSLKVPTPIFSTLFFKLFEIFESQERSYFLITHGKFHS